MRRTPGSAASRELAAGVGRVAATRLTMPKSRSATPPWAAIRSRRAAGPKPGWPMTMTFWAALSSDLETAKPSVGATPQATATRPAKMIKAGIFLCLSSHVGKELREGDYIIIKRLSTLPGALLPGALGIGGGEGAKKILSQTISLNHFITSSLDSLKPARVQPPLPSGRADEIKL